MKMGNAVFTLAEIYLDKDTVKTGNDGIYFSFSFY